MHIFKYFLFFLILIVCGCAVCEKNRIYNERMLHSIYSDEDKWNSLINDIESGDEENLARAIMLWRVSEAGSYEELSYAFGEALKNNPQYLLGGNLDEVEVESICRGPDIDSGIYNTYEIVSEEIDRLISFLAATNIKGSQKYKVACLKSLRSSYKGYQRFFGVDEGE